MVDSKIKGFGERIHKLAKMQGISQKELSRKAGCTETAMTRYINDDRTPNGDCDRDKFVATLDLYKENIEVAFDIIKVFREQQNDHFARGQHKYDEEYHVKRLETIANHLLTYCKSWED